MSVDDRELARRAEAIERLLIDKGLLGADTVDEIVRAYEQDIGPLNGARLVARAWSDAAFRERLLADARTAALELGIAGMEADNLVAVANTAEVHNVVVCTLCSCYPWAVLGLPPSWYKSPAYRARIVREPRAVLREFGLELPASTAIEVWDSSAEIRYLVLPACPPEARGRTEEELVEWVTRDSMIGTGVARRPS